jgi:hypothetical protein
MEAPGEWGFRKKRRPRKGGYGAVGWRRVKLVASDVVLAGFDQFGYCLVNGVLVAGGRTSVEDPVECLFVCCPQVIVASL